MSKESPVSKRASMKAKLILDSDSDNDFYSNFVAKHIKTKKTKAVPKLEDKLTIPIPVLSENALRSLDSDDSLGSGDDDTDFMEKLRKKAEQGRIEKEKKLEKELQEIASLTSKDEYSSGSGFVDRLSSYDKIISDVSRIKHVRKGRFDRNAKPEQSFCLEDETPNIKRVKKERCFIQIIDLDDPFAKHPLISLEMTEPFSNIRRILAEKKECSIGSIHLTQGIVDIRDNQTPTVFNFVPEEIYKLECLVVRGNTTIALKCQKRGSGPLTIHAEKTETFSEISKKIKDKGIEFDYVMFDGVEIPMDETPETIKLQEDDLLDLL